MLKAMWSPTLVRIWFVVILGEVLLTSAVVVNSLSSSQATGLSSVISKNELNASRSTGCVRPLVLHGVIGDETAVGFSVGNIVEISCQSGYRFPHIKSTVLQAVCRADGVWRMWNDEDVPSCELIGGCPVPLVTNGYVLQKLGGFMPGDVAVIVCNSNYVRMPKTSRPFVMCSKDGSWSSGDSDFPTCIASSSSVCSYPPSIEHGDFQFVGVDSSYSASALNGSVSSGVRALYYCYDGFRMSSDVPPVIECSGGSWSGTPPSCQSSNLFEHCGPAPDVTHGRYFIVNGSLDRNGSFRRGSKLLYVCDAGYRPECSTCLLTATCGDGDWIGHGPKCVPELGCAMPPPVVGHAAYVISRRDETSTLAYPDGSQVPDGSLASYYCNNGYHLLETNATTLMCKNGNWLGMTPSCVKRTGCDLPMDIENGNWIIRSLRGVENGKWIVHSSVGDFPFGVNVTYGCEPGYKAIGASEITCLASGYWSDYPPKCLAQDEYCVEPMPVRDGFFMCKPSQCDSFRVGTELHYLCNKNYKLSATDHTSRPFVLTCQPGGHWSHEQPVCLPDFVIGSSYVTQSISFSTNTVTVVVSSSCAVLGLLIIVMLAVALQRHVKRNGSTRLCPPSLPGNQTLLPSGASSSSAAPMMRNGVEQDRLALIAFADDVRGAAAAGLNVPLPTYEEAIRCGTVAVPHVYHGFSHFVDGNSRTSSGRSSRSGEYRPLPSIRVMRDAVVVPVSSPSLSSDPRRNSIITNASNQLWPAVFGSMDTVNAAASDATSTSVTVDTYDSMASNPSIVASQRATAGSIESSSTHGSLMNEAAPLLDSQRDAAGCDTLRSQSSNGTHSDAASRIVEASDENNKMN